MRMHFSTQALPAELRRDAVATAYSSHVNGLIDFPDERAIATEMWLRQLSDINIAMVDTSPVHIHTPPADTDALYLGIAVAGGGVIDALGEARQVKAGDVNVMARDRHCMTVADRPSRILSIMIPNGRILHRLSDHDSLSATRSVSMPAARLLGAYATLMLSEEGALSGREQEMFSSHIVDLAVLLLGGGRDATLQAKRNGARAARRRAIKADIRDQLQNPDLSLEWLSRRHQLSASYIRSLFYDEGETFTDFVTETRLDCVARLLRDPPHAHQTIAAIAFLGGFNDISWFNKLFRRRFGKTPSEWRAIDD